MGKKYASLIEKSKDPNLSEYEKGLVRGQLKEMHFQADMK